MAHRHRPLVMAKNQLPPQGGCGGQAFRQRGGDDRGRESSGGEEGQGQERCEHFDKPCSFRRDAWRAADSWR
jgi:hypothetical protein